MTRTVLLDFESRSECSIDLGGRAYWAHPSTEAICCWLYVVETDEWLLWLPGDPCPVRPDDLLVAHNMTGFDRFGCVALGWRASPLFLYVDTSELARTAGLPGALDELAKRWLGREKDHAGNAVTRRLSGIAAPLSKKEKGFRATIDAPIIWGLSAQEIRASLVGRGITPGKTIRVDGEIVHERVVWAVPPEVVAALKTYKGAGHDIPAVVYDYVLGYCRSDVEILRDAWPRLKEWIDAELPGVVEADRTINERGIRFDVPLAHALLREDERGKRSAAEALAVEVDCSPDDLIAAANSPAQFCEITGAENAQAATVATIDHPLARLRERLASIASGKLTTALASLSPDGRLRDILRYYAAHAQPNSELVHTPGGYVLMGSLRVGDVVSGRCAPTRVLGVYPQGAREVFKVTFSDGSSARADADHLWHVRTIDGAEKVLRTAELGALKQGKKHKYRIPLIAPRPEPRTSLPIDPYTLGALLGDGCLRGSTPRFTSGDPCIVERFVLPEGVRIVARPVPGKKATHYRLSSGSRGNYTRPRNPLTVLIANLGLWGCDSFTKFVPHAYVTADPESRLELLRGLFDTDGSAKSAGVVKYATCSARLRDDVIELVQSLGGTARYYEAHSNDGVIYDVQCRLPPGLVAFHVPRKANRHATTRRAPVRTIIAVRPDGREECTCIEVDALDRLYQTRAHIVTHNTGRWGGARFQPQNLPRPDKRFEQEVESRLKREGLPKSELGRLWDEMICGLADRAIAGERIEQDEIDLLLRACLVPSPGNVLVFGDLSAVEGRGLAWAADDHDAMAVYASGRDPYKVAATLIYGCSYEGVEKWQRQIGKVAELALGYQGGKNAFSRMAKAYGVDVSTLDVDAIVAAWRAGRAPTKQWWAELQAAFISAFVDRRPCMAGKYVRFDSDGERVEMVLPSGRVIAYWGVQIEPGAYGPSISYDGGQFREHLYGGKLAENAVQAFCRDLLARAIVLLEKDGVPIVLHVHDEAVGDVPRSRVAWAKERIYERLTAPPDWAPGLLLDASVEEGERYRK